MEKLTQEIFTIISKELDAPKKSIKENSYSSQISKDL